MKLKLEKITISKISNPSTIKGGNDNTQGQTIGKKRICVDQSRKYIDIQE